MLILGILVLCLGLFISFAGREIAMDLGPGPYTVWLIGSSFTTGTGGALIVLSFM